MPPRRLFHLSWRSLLPQVGLQLRNADPALMKEFVLGVHERAAALGKDGERRKRMAGHTGRA